MADEKLCPICGKSYHYSSCSHSQNELIAFAQGKLAERKEIMELMEDILSQACYEPSTDTEPPTYFSRALSAYADGLKWLVSTGKYEHVYTPVGRMVKIRLKSQSQPKVASSYPKATQKGGRGEEGMNFIKEFGEECKELGMKVKKTKDGIEITPTNESMERLFLLMGAIPQKKLKASRGEQGEKR
jgi:hypothetical protein